MESGIAAKSHVWGAIRTILIADAVMSLDNVVAIAAAAHGSALLIAFGLAISIPLIVFGSQLVLRVLNRFADSRGARRRSARMDRRRNHGERPVRVHTSAIQRGAPGPNREAAVVPCWSWRPERSCPAGHAAREQDVVDLAPEDQK